MTGNFHCKKCDIVFTAEGTKVEYNDPVFGPCASYRADCPECGADCGEKIKPKVQKKSSVDSVPSCGDSKSCCCGL